MTAVAYEVRITAGAEKDLEDIVDFLADSYSPAVAETVLDQLLTQISTLEALPFRGATVKELDTLGAPQYRQLVMSHYRLIYLVEERAVYITVIADGRRDMQELLQRRLLGR
jgi:toxin ParE1/3/4